MSDNVSASTDDDLPGWEVVSFVRVIPGLDRATQTRVLLGIGDSRSRRRRGSDLKLLADLTGDMFLQGRITECARADHRLADAFRLSHDSHFKFHVARGASDNRSIQRAG